MPEIPTTRIARMMDLRCRHRAVLAGTRQISQRVVSEARPRFGLHVLFVVFEGWWNLATINSSLMLSSVGVTRSLPFSPQTGAGLSSSRVTHAFQAVADNY